MLVAFDDAAMLARRLRAAAGVFRLSPAQTRLALGLLEGRDLGAIAAGAGVSVNTLRTQLQRMFDKTGARSRAALVGLLLGTDAPAG
ncbi:hypothetical protein [Amaricoccus sp.]|uniref:hypothetical protein n=1 Tax=Amaricoccus sp. TaxID=1872485 RepID=UPI001B61B96B|nr:hypothetical protein [Amaricoccus sp.]MBP7001863.1 hypothetical protein [Amaricoccus sp.]